MSLQANNITFKYFPKSKDYILEDISTTIPKGKTILLIGKSGSGKSTLAYILAGLYPDNAGVLESGTVTVDGVNLTMLTPNQRVSYVTMMFQNPDLQFCMNNIEQELMFCLENMGVQEIDMPPLVENALNELGIIHLRKQPFHTLSGGEKQKCALACIIALGSKYIILDEAFANIDPFSAREIIKKLRTLDVTILAIDHNLKLWENHYDEIISLDGSFITEFDMQAKLPAVNGLFLQTSGLTVNNIDYPDVKINKGSINAIVGRSGSGKTTLFKTLINHYKYQGEIILNGKELKKIRQRQLFQTIGIVFQNPANQFIALTVYDEVLTSVKRWHKKESLLLQQAKARELLIRFKLDKYGKYAPYMLSQGQQRRLAVLTMIAGAQELLLLDEPTYGQDYENICALMELLVEKVNAGLTVIFTTHNLYIAEHFSHQVIKVGDDNE